MDNIRSNKISEIKGMSVKGNLNVPIICVSNLDIFYKY